MREGRCVFARRWGVGLFAGVLLAAGGASANMKYGPLELSGNMETENLVRHQTADELQFVMNRNTFRLRMDYDWLQKGKLIDRFDVPFLERSKLFVLLRGVYDGFYDIAPSNLQHGQTRWDDKVGGRITDLSNSQRTSVKWQNEVREAYIDAKMKDLPLSFRIGRQQVIWGESDQNRIMDLWNPLDTSWHVQQESWDNIRIPQWLAKGLWDIGDVWKFSNVFNEFVYNPFDFEPGAKVKWLPRPWALPLPDPTRAGQVDTSSLIPYAISPDFNLHGTSFRRGDFQRNPADASEVGERFHFVAPGGVETSLIYMYGRGRGLGTASPFGFRFNSMKIGGASSLIGNYQVDSSQSAAAPGNTIPVRTVTVDGKIVHPYMHIFGLTANYFEDWSEFVIRMESGFALGEPYQTTQADKLPIVYSSNGRPFTTGPMQLEKRDVWAGMIGFDRPTWMRWINPNSTIFLSGQFFWSYVCGHNVDKLVGTAGAGDDPYYGQMGQWLTGPYAGKAERRQNSDLKGNGDNIRQWEHLVTMAATTFYRGGTMVPFGAAAWDPVNSNLELLWSLDYYYTNNFIITLNQKYFMTYGSGLPSNDPWYAGGRLARRDETGVKLTYQY